MYKLVWQDDFNGLLDFNVWSFLNGHGNYDELEHYTDDEEHIFIENSCLNIRATKSESGEHKYISSRIVTKGKKNFLYGKLEMRAKLPGGSGIWPAFWTLGDTDVKWPGCGEIDILELLGGRGSDRDGMGDSQIWSSIHCPDRPKSNWGPFSLENKQSLCDDFHIYGMVWNEETITFYIDDQINNCVNIKDYPMFHIPHFILINVAVGGDWPGNPDETTVFPQTFQIDWIKYYKDE